MRELTVGKNDAGQRADKFLLKTLVNMPKSLLYKSIRLKKIKRNGARLSPEAVLCEGDVLRLFISDEFFKEETGAVRLDRVHPRIDVLYEDANVLLINKKPGVSVHEDETQSGDNLLVQMQAYLYRKGEYDPSREHSFAPALCNRIDRNTGGIVIAAKNAEALRLMNEKIRLRELDKYYLCAVHGVPTPSAATLCAYLAKDEKSKLVTVLDRLPPSKEKASAFKHIKTRYKTLAVKGDLALLEVELLTGRTHQIRAHMAHIGHPLLGDGKYGCIKGDRALGYKHQALYAYRLVFSFKKDEAPHALSYLDGRAFEIPYRDIYFTSLFDGE